MKETIKLTVCDELMKLEEADGDKYENEDADKIEPEHQVGRGQEARTHTDLSLWQC